MNQTFFENINNPEAIVYRFSSRDIRATPDQVARYFGGPRFKPDRRHLEQITTFLERAAGLIEPAYITALYPLAKKDLKGRICIGNGVTLPVPVNRLNALPRQLAVCVCTLGGRLDETCRDFSDHHNIYDATLMDAVGISLADALADRVHRRIMKQATDLGLFAGCRFGPGYGDMPMTAQTDLFRLVNADSIGVKLNGSLMMDPVKSLSFLVVLGARQSRTGSAGKCSHCGLKSCQFRVFKIK